MAQNRTPPPSPATAPVNIPNYLVISVISVLFRLPMAILAMINAAKVNKLIAAGDTKGALEASAGAKKWAYTSIGLGVAIIVICIIGMIAFFIFAGAAPRPR